MKVKLRDVNLNVEVTGGEKAPCVTLVTGITNDHTLWHEQVADLSREHRLIRIDWRGHGLSDSFPAPYSLNMLVGDVIGVWDALGVSRSVIGGLGLGGVAAAEVALGHPTRVSGLVPISCRASMVPEYGAMWPPLIELAKAQGVPAVADRTLGRWFSDAFRSEHPVVIERMRAALLRTTLDGYLGAIAALLELNWGGRLQELKMPVMYVSGELDRVGAPSEVMQAMCEATPHATHAVLPGASHISVVSNAPAFTAAMLEFLRRV
jgi:3-oxoadipate enol-lactonase